MSEKKRTDGAQPTAVVVGVGAERGLGAALCRRFAAAGHHVFVAGRTAEKLDVVVRQIKAGGRQRRGGDDGRHQGSRCDRLVRSRHVAGCGKGAGGSGRL